MRRVTNRLRPLILSGLLLALPLTDADAKNVKPDPNGLPPQDVKDLHYGDVLFYFFQDDYFDSITRLLAARQLERISHTHRYQLTPDGLRIALFFSRTYARLLRPKLAEIMPEAPPINSALRTAFDRLKSEIDACCEEQRLAA